MATREKRTSETRDYDFDFGLDLGTGVTIASVTDITTDQTTIPPLTFGTPAINTLAVTYQDGYIAPVGTVVQVSIGGGAISAGRQVKDYTLRCVALDSNGETVEGTVILRLNDTPPP